MSLICDFNVWHTTAHRGMGHVLVHRARTCMWACVDVEKAAVYSISVITASEAGTQSAWLDEA